MLAEASVFSHSHRVSPLTHAEQAQAQKIFLTHRPTASYKHRVRQILETQVPRLKASAPNDFSDATIASLSLHSTLMPAALRAESKKQKILDDLCPPALFSEASPGSPAVPVLRGRPRARQPSHLYLHKHLRSGCNYEANPRYCTFANSWSTPCREHSTCLYLCTVLLLRLVHEM